MQCTRYVILMLMTYDGLDSFHYSIGSVYSRYIFGKTDTFSLDTFGLSTTENPTKLGNTTQVGLTELGLGSLHAIISGINSSWCLIARSTHWWVPACVSFSSQHMDVLDVQNTVHWPINTIVPVCCPLIAK